MIKLEGDNFGIEPRVDGMQNPATHGHAVVTLQHRRRVEQNDGDRIPSPNPKPRCQSRTQLPRPFIERSVTSAKGAVDDGGVVGKDGG